MLGSQASCYLFLQLICELSRVQIEGPKNIVMHFVITETLLSFTIALKKYGLREHATNDHAKVVKKERVYNLCMK